MAEGVQEVKKNIQEIVDKRIVASLAVCEWYTGYAITLFRKFQSMNAFWTNRTGTAYARVFADILSTTDEIGWFIAHAVEYGVYLELANDRKHEALRPIVNDLYAEFMRDIKAIWE